MKGPADGRQYIYLVASKDKTATSVISLGCKEVRATSFQGIVISDVPLGAEAEVRIQYENEKESGSLHVGYAVHTEILRSWIDMVNKHILEGRA